MTVKPREIVDEMNKIKEWKDNYVANGGEPEPTDVTNWFPEEITIEGEEGSYSYHITRVDMTLPGITYSCAILLLWIYGGWVSKLDLIL